MAGMKKMTARAALPAVVVAALVSMTCTNPLSNVVNRDIAADQASHQPSAQVNPDIPSGQTVTAHEILKLTFTESIDTQTVTYSGELAGGSPVWTTTSKENDTLTWSPPSKYWPAGAAQKLSISGKTKAGGSIASNTVTYQVFRGMCVSATGSDLQGTGSVKSPYLTIGKGISQANATYGNPSQVRVSAGTYHVSSSIVMVEGISLLGAYDPTFTSRAYDSAHMVEVFNDATSGATSRPPTGTVSCSGISSATILDGFTIHAGGTAGSPSTVYFAAVTVDAGSSVKITNNALTGAGNLLPFYDLLYIRDSRPTIQHDTISGNGGDKTGDVNGVYYDDTKSDPGTCQIADNVISTGTATASTAVNGTTGIWIAHNTGAALLVQRNTITAGQAYTTAYGIGVYMNNATTTDGVVVRNNVVEARMSATNYGIAVSNAQPAILNNTIAFQSMGSSPYRARGIQLNTGASPRIENNIFADVHAYATSPHVAFGIYAQTASIVPRTVLNNDFFCFDSDTQYFDVYYDTSTWHAVADMEGHLGSGVANSNISVNPAFVDLAGSDYHLASATQASTGGKDLSASFTDDHDSVTRIVPWSIGAYQRN